MISPGEKGSASTGVNHDNQAPVLAFNHGNCEAESILNGVLEPAPYIRQFVRTVTGRPWMFVKTARTLQVARTPGSWKGPNLQGLIQRRKYLRLINIQWERDTRYDRTRTRRV